MLLHGLLAVCVRQVGKRSIDILYLLHLQDKAYTSLGANAQPVVLTPLENAQQLQQGQHMLPARHDISQLANQ